MVNTTSLVLYLDQILPDSRIVEDLSVLLRSSSSKKEVAIELEGVEIQVPCDVTAEVVTKAFFKDRCNTGFGTLRAQVALGDVTNPSPGVAFAQYCFATLYYDEDCNLITTDFHKQLR